MACGRLLLLNRLHNRLHVCRFGNCGEIRYCYSSGALRPRGELIVIEHWSTIGNPSVGERKKEGTEREKGGARRTRVRRRPNQ